MSVRCNSSYRVDIVCPLIPPAHLRGIISLSVRMVQGGFFVTVDQLNSSYFHTTGDFVVNTSYQLMNGSKEHRYVVNLIVANNYLFPHYNGETFI